jgi:hypothetical protein
MENDYADPPSFLIYQDVIQAYTHSYEESSNASANDISFPFYELANVQYIGYRVKIGIPSSPKIICARSTKSDRNQNQGYPNLRLRRSKSNDLDYDKTVHGGTNRDKQVVDNDSNTMLVVLKQSVPAGHDHVCSCYILIRDDMYVVRLV